MKYKSVFDIIGPVMVGPSSSHTAGAARIGRVARTVFGREPKRAVITFYGSFAKTYKGHGSDVATVAGILDFDTYDLRMKDSFEIAKERGIEVILRTSDEMTDHPNTSRIQLSDDQGSLEVAGVSIGGGKIEITEINGFPLKLSGNAHTLMVLHEDRYGMIAAVSNILTKYEINIGHMEVSRRDRGDEALMVIEVDSEVGEGAVEEIEQIPHIRGVSVLLPT
ncbi:L-serine ammonia-lyase, iron-sulfur-dependent subunit beta [Brevibacillus humidisoli]|uniref:L-serine ammonia-lyase, iron-sulfur-dependent subunit beta n=1 Tax=Brevibacillus humidisoli TaxID=2895522 RepID=UPI001E45C7E4|nr:L-serine ammonia-lyase, iron-sulfur-dependent subunit beta [Brevibacillus humidisoli]UFJ41995.1 L-serine ammonia-lyase, iron-sulfur-dependent subunit beta [Brevibacillus humidisoli]